jgi:SAM-dependent methyltransferase
MARAHAGADTHTTPVTRDLPPMPIPFLPFRRPASGTDPFPVAMTGVRTGERVLQVGGDDPVLAGLLAAKPGLNGHAALVVASEAHADAVRKATEGTLVDIHVTPLDGAGPGGAGQSGAGSSGTGLGGGIEAGSFDLVVVHGRKGLVSSMPPEARANLLRACHRALRPGGRVVIVDAGTPQGVMARLRPAPASEATYRESGGPATALTQAGFSAVRAIGDREGYLFTEGVRPAV